MSPLSALLAGKAAAKLSQQRGVPVAQTEQNSFPKGEAFLDS